MSFVNLLLAILFGGGAEGSNSGLLQLLIASLFGG